MATAASEYGVVSQATWTSSDSMVLAVASDGTITGVGPGQATLTAETNGVSAQATITVAATGAALGSIPWSLAPDPAGGGATPLIAQRVSDDGPDLFSISTDYDARVSTVTALRSDGTQIGVETTPGIPQFGDAFGGLVTLIPPDGLPFYSSSGGAALGKIGGSADAPPWQFDSSDSNTPAPIRPGPAQASDGTTYFVEERRSSDGNSDGAVVGLDGQTGQVKFRVPLPRSSSKYSQSPTCSTSFGHTSSSYYAAATGPIFVAADGSAYLEIRESHDSYSRTCEERPYVCLSEDFPFRRICTSHAWLPGSGTFSNAWELKLMRVDNSGSSTVHSLRQFAQSMPDTLNNWALYGEDVSPGSIAPDGLGGVLAYWAHTDYDAGTTDGHITRVVGAAQEDHTGNWAYFAGWSPVQLVADNGTAYVRSDDGSLSAIDVTTWTTKWSEQTDAMPIIATDGGNVILSDTGTPALVEVDSTGATVTTTVLSAPLENPLPVLRGQGRLHGQNAVTGALSEFEIAELVEAADFFIAGSPPIDSTCKQPPHSLNQNGLILGGTYKYLFVDDSTIVNGIWSDAEKSAVVEAFTRWQAADSSSGVTYTFVRCNASQSDAKKCRVSDDQPASVEEPSLTLNKFNLLPTGGRPTIGSTLPLDQGSTTRTFSRATIRLTTDSTRLQQPIGFMKAALHEIGHLHALGDNQGFHGSTVMNLFGEIASTGGSTVLAIQRMDDFPGNVAPRPTSCDVKNAKAWAGVQR